MPLYEYKCSICHTSFEIQHKMFEDAPRSAPGCTRKDCCLEKQLSAVAGVVKSPNPFAAAANQMSGVGGQPPTSQASSPKNHQCGSGCALHSH